MKRKQEIKNVYCRKDILVRYLLSCLLFILPTRFITGQNCFDIQVRNYCTASFINQFPAYRQIIEDALNEAELVFNNANFDYQWHLSVAEIESIDEQWSRNNSINALLFDYQIYFRNLNPQKNEYAILWATTSDRIFSSHFINRQACQKNPLCIQVVNARFDHDLIPNEFIRGICRNFGVGHDTMPGYFFSQVNRTEIFSPQSRQEINTFLRALVDCVPLSHDCETSTSVTQSDGGGSHLEIRNFSIYNPEHISYAIYTANGQNMLRSNAEWFNFHHLEPGLYFIKDNNRQLTRFVR